MQSQKWPNDLGSFPRQTIQHHSTAFKLWCWRRLLRIPWAARRSNQLILMEIHPECSLEGLLLKLKLQYFSHLMQRANSLEKTWCWERLRAGGEGDGRAWDGSIASLTQWTWIWANSWREWRTGKPGMLQSIGSQRVRYDLAMEHTHTCDIRMTTEKVKAEHNSSSYLQFLWEHAYLN